MTPKDAAAASWRVEETDDETYIIDGELIEEIDRARTRLYDWAEKSRKP